TGPPCPCTTSGNGAGPSGTARSPSISSPSGAVHAIRSRAEGPAMSAVPDVRDEAITRTASAAPGRSVFTVTTSGGRVQLCRTVTNPFSPSGAAHGYQSPQASGDDQSSVAAPVDASTFPATDSMPGAPATNRRP